MIDGLALRFCQLQIPRVEWTHVAHLAVGLWHVREFGSVVALERLRNGIRKLNESHGNSNTAESGYHETITRAYVQLLAEFLNQFSDDVSTDKILEKLLASPLAGRDALLDFYSRELLHSSAARLNWTPPDVTPLCLTQLLAT